MVGELVCSGIGTPLAAEGVKDVASLRSNCCKYNEALLAQLKEDAQASELLRCMFVYVSLASQMW